MPLQADVALQKLPPQNLEAEQMVLGAVLIENSAIETVSDILSPDDFYKDAHRRIFGIMQEMADRKEAIALITITDALRHGGMLEKVGGASYLSALVGLVPTAANVKYHASIVHDKSALRQLIHASTDIITQSYGDAPEPLTIEKILDRAQQAILHISDQKKVAAFVSMSEIVKHGFATIEQLYERKEAVTGLPTGFTDLDKLTSGLQAGDLIIVAGRPSMGKTALCLNIAAYTALENAKRVAFFSLEMAKEQLGLRMLCSEARIDAHKLRTGFLAETDWGRLSNAAGRLAEAPIYIDDTGAIGIFEMRSKARRLKADKGLDLIIVDYLQLMRGSDGAASREQEISSISRSLKALAKELRVPVIALSQLNRAVETRPGKEKRPMLADLRESGAIEQDADVILFIYRDEVYNRCECPPPPGECSCGRRGTAEVIIGKQRNGPTDTVRLTYIKQYTRFENAETRHF